MEVMITLVKEYVGTVWIPDDYYEEFDDDEDVDLLTYVEDTIEDYYDELSPGDEYVSDVVVL